MFAALEFKTMLFMSGLLAVALSILLLAIHQRSAMLKGLKYWVYANLLISFAIISFIQQDYSLETRAFLGGLLMVSGLFMYLVSIRIFELHPLNLKLIKRAMAALVFSNLLISLFSNNVYVSVVFNTALCMLLSLASAIYLLHYSRYKHHGEHQFTGLCFIVFTGFTSYRFYVLALDSVNPVEHLTAWNLNELTFLACMLSVLAINFGFIAMVNEKLVELLEQSTKLDWLTGILNRKNLEKNAEIMAAQTLKFKQSHAMLLMDLDKFKSINDTYGHLFGDQVIQVFADLIKDNVREIDLIGRYGGEEFCVLMPNSTESEALILAERIRQKYEATPILYNGEAFKFTVSIGVCDSNKAGMYFKNMFSAADQSLYVAKSSGRNQVAIFSRLNLE